MREIKFRAWDNEDKKMWKVVAISDSIWGDCEEAHIRVCGFHENPSKKETDVRMSVDYKLMQYTGLYDNTGNEIYEGDIVRVWENDEMIPERDCGGGIIDFNRHEGFSQLGTVSYKGAWFAYETKKHLEGRKEQIFAPLDFCEGIEVIGNIYENPELLEVEANA
jgi:uncharacterized phage protein (TIGR01671 family)